MSFTTVFDQNYFRTFYDEVYLSNKRSSLSRSLTALEDTDLAAMVNILAYKLSEASAYSKTVDPSVGGQEHIHLYNHTDPEVRTRSVGYVLDALQNCVKAADLEELFQAVSVCMTSPLYYTRIDEDILARMHVSTDALYKGMLYGKMLKIYARRELTMRKDTTILASHKLSYWDLGDVDIWDNDNFLLFVLSVSDKADTDVHVYKYFKDLPFIRVCSSATKNYLSKRFNYRQIPHSKLCCMIDTGDIYKLERITIDDTSKGELHLFNGSTER